MRNHVTLYKPKPSELNVILKSLLHYAPAGKIQRNLNLFTTYLLDQYVPSMMLNVISLPKQCNITVFRQ